MATTKNSKSSFEVVPREIRDQIYGLTFDHDIERERFMFRFQAPCPHLRLVSRQLKDEYDEQDERTPKSATLLAAGRGGNSILTLPHPDDRHKYEARTSNTMGPSASAADATRQFISADDDTKKKSALSTEMRLVSTKGTMAIPRLPARQSVPGIAKKCTSLQVVYFMPKPKPSSWAKEIDITHFVPDIRRMVLDLGRELQQAEVLLVWKSTSTIQSFAIKCELSIPSILSRLRTSRSSNTQFRDSFPLLYQGHFCFVRFVHQDFDSCGDLFQGRAIGGTFDNHTGTFKTDGREDENI